MSLEEKRAVRPALEDCLKDPTEVWWNKEEIEAVDYYYYKYIKLFSNLVFVAFVVIDDASNFELNNFYGYHENEFNLAEQERKGQLILSNSRQQNGEENNEIVEEIVPGNLGASIGNSLYEKEGKMNGLEERVIMKISTKPNIEFWHRNLDRAKGFS